MNVTEAIAKRRSIRKFKETEVDDKDMATIIESARLCQSGKNRQPWKFMILKGDEKNHIVKLMTDYLASANPEEIQAYGTLTVSAKAIEAAPVLILVFKDRDEDAVKNESDIMSIGAAIEHMALTALDLGLGSLWLRQILYVKKEICEFVGYPDLHLLSGISIGVADEEPKARPRKATEEILLKRRENI